jgi:pimeloyl-ACP methyl ester carboxylesterase
LRHLVDDVAAIVSTAGYLCAHVGEHDWGGTVAWTFAGIYPELLNKLVILNAPHMKIYSEKVWRTSQCLRSWYVLLFQLPGVPEWLLSRRNFNLVRHMFAQRPARQGTFSMADIEQYISGLSRPGALTTALNYYRVNLFSDGFTLARAARTNAPTIVI